MNKMKLEKNKVTHYQKKEVLNKLSKAFYILHLEDRKTSQSSIIEEALVSLFDTPKYKEILNRSL